MSTTTRTLIGFLLLVSAGFYFLMDRLIDRVERQYLEAAEEPMVDMAHVMASVIEEDFGAGSLDLGKLRRAFDSSSRRRFEAQVYNLLKERVDMNVYVTDARGIVVFDSRGEETEGMDFSKFNDVHRTLRGWYGARSTRTVEEDEFSSVMYVGAPLHKDGNIIGMVSVSKPQASMFEFIAETKERIVYYGWSILVATMLAAVLVSHWFSSPIRKLTEYARAVRRGERVSSPELVSPDMKVLAGALEGMRDSLEDRKYVETYVQTLTHEMKSPVAAIRGATELLQEGTMPPEQRGRFLSNIRTETERLQNVIDRLLALAAIESKKSLENPVDLALTELIDEVCVAHAHACETRQVELKKDYRCRPVVRAEAFLLEIAVGNLLQNAIEFSPTGGTVRVIVVEDSVEGTVKVMVEDEGPGVPEYAMERVFDRFYSLKHPATGKKSSGLGLCFVREAAELHGGVAVLENVDEGTRATLTIAI